MKKILVVEDDSDILEAVQMVLINQGYAAKGISKGEETYQKVTDYKPDAIIMDLLLSGADGGVICKNLKQNKMTHHIPIIMISAHPLAGEAAKKCGAESFVAKPFSLIDLLKAVERCTGKSN